MAESKDEENKRIPFVGFQSSSYDETHMQKMKRKIKENPLVPIGMGATVAALVLGIFNFKKGNQKNQQFMMRARVAAQGGTIIALVTGLYFAAMRDKKNKNK